MNTGSYENSEKFLTAIKDLHELYIDSLKKLKNSNSTVTEIKTELNAMSEITARLTETFKIIHIDEPYLEDFKIFESNLNKMQVDFTTAYDLANENTNTKKEIKKVLLPYALLIENLPDRKCIISKGLIFKKNIEIPFNPSTLKK